MTVIEPGTAIVIAAHGDRGSAERNAVLRCHAEALRLGGRFAYAGHGVLNGEPQIESVLKEAESAGAQRVLIYPFFMSGGYFAGKVLPQRILKASLAVPVTLLEPLGLNPALPPLLLRRSLDRAREAALAPENTRLIVAAHGSKFGRASAEAAEQVAEVVRRESPFYETVTAFIEEPPFIADALRSATQPVVVAGLFSGEGLHGHDDLDAAIQRAGAPCVYTRPIGGDPSIPGIIEAAIERMLASGL
jgi:sirohydrochlorin cobaltochelatase